MEKLITILLTQYKSGGEAMVVGLLQGVLIFGGIAIYRGIKKTIKGKEFEEVKDDSKNKPNTDIK